MKFGTGLWYQKETVPILCIYLRTVWIPFLNWFLLDSSCSKRVKNWVRRANTKLLGIFWRPTNTTHSKCCVPNCKIISEMQLVLWPSSTRIPKSPNTFCQNNLESVFSRWLAPGHIICCLYKRLLCSTSSLLVEKMANKSVCRGKIEPGRPLPHLAYAGMCRLTGYGFQGLES